jgi:2-oxoglutarate ferredoxin oxidoreductase subunit alpha
MISFGQGHRFHVTGLVHDQSGFPTNEPAKIDELLRRLDRKITRYAGRIIQVEQQFEEEAEVGVIAYGSPARSAKQAAKMARGEGIAVSFLALLSIWPFPAQHVKRMGEQVSDIIVPELNLGQIAHEVEWAVEGKSRVHRLSRLDGEPISPRQILDRIHEVAGR